MHTGKRNGIERVEDAVDYEWLFDHFFDNAINDQSGHLLEAYIQDEKLPFEYCEKALAHIGSSMPYYNKAWIASRRDCPDDVLIDICRDVISSKKEVMINFVNALCRYSRFKKTIPREALDMIMETDAYTELCYCFSMPDDMKSMLLKKIGLLEVEDMQTPDILDSRFFNLYQKFSVVQSYVEHQHSVPEDCMRSLNCLYDFFTDESYMAKTRRSYDLWNKQFGMKNLLFSIKLMQIPLEDGTIDEMFSMPDELCKWSASMKCVMNPSISDYGIMQVLIKSEQEYDEIQSVINRLVNESKPKREEYRRMHEES